MRSVRGDELPEELSNIGAKALDVGAYRAWDVWHPFVIAAWTELGIDIGCYHDIAFRTGDCTDEVSIGAKGIDGNSIMCMMETPYFRTGETDSTGSSLLIICDTV